MAGMAIPSGAQDGAIRMAGNAVGLENLKVERSGSNLVVDMDLRLDDLKMPSNIRFVFTPLVKGSGNVRQMSPVVVNGVASKYPTSGSPARTLPEARWWYAAGTARNRRYITPVCCLTKAGWKTPTSCWPRTFAGVGICWTRTRLCCSGCAITARLTSARRLKRGKNGVRKAGLIWISPSTKRPFIRTTATIRRNWRRYSVPSTW